MAKTKIAFSLSESDIEKAIEALRTYSGEVKEKTARLRGRIAEEIAATAENGFGSAVVDDLLTGGARSASVDVRIDDRDNLTVVIASGEDAIWVEFGAGVYFNGSPGTSPHPRGQGLGMTIGSYGKGRGKRRVWGYYDEGGALVLTHGTPASMPMYNAAKIVCGRIDEIAREVFA